MTTISAQADDAAVFGGAAANRLKLDTGPNARTAVILFETMAIGLFFVAHSLYADVTASGARPMTWPFNVGCLQSCSEFASRGVGQLGVLWRC